MQDGAPIKDHEALGRVLALLGQSRISSNLNELSKAAKAGVLPLDAQTVVDIQKAHNHILQMRNALMKTPGLRVRIRINYGYIPT